MFGVVEGRFYFDQNANVCERVGPVKRQSQKFVL